jgi:hypothetical protein
VSSHDDAFDQAFWMAVEDMNAGVAKPIESYLKLVPRREQDELARMLADVLAARGPAPTPSASETEGYARTLAIIDEVLGTVSPAGVLAPALKAMRDARGIEREDVVATLAADFEIQSTAGRRELERQYHYLETGKRLGSKLKKSLIDSLARIFDIDARDLLAAVRPTDAVPRLTAAPAMGRESGVRDSTRAVRAVDAAPDPEVERVRHLFNGGPDD